MYPEPAPYQCYALLQVDVSMRQDNEKYFFFWKSY